MRIIIGMSGASGIIYGVRLLEVLSAIKDCETHLVISKGAKLAIKQESDRSLKAIEALADVVHNDQNLAASISSGSFKTDGMVIAPCSMKTLSAVANSYGENLLTRAADVMLKEKKKLILVPRETPSSLIHVKNFELLLLAGAIILPANPSFYMRPQTVEQVVDTVVARVLDHIGVAHQLVKRWAEEKE